MGTSIMTLLDKFEDPNYPLLGPTLYALQKWRMHRPGNSGFSSNIIHIIGFLFVFSQYVELWRIRSDLQLAIRNLSSSTLTSITVLKAISYILWQKQWKEVIEFITYTEKRQTEKNDNATNAIIKEYTKYSRMVTFLYTILATATAIMMVLAPLIGYLSSIELRERVRNKTAPCPEIFSAWTPFDRTRGFGYWLSVVAHVAICAYGCGIVASYDCNVFVLMAFFAGQLKILSSNCKRMFDEEGIGYKEAINRIRECHYHRVSLLKFSAILNSLLSPVMFLYVIICSLMICASAIQLTTEGTTNMQRVWIAEYVTAMIAQLFLYCWHSNEVLYMSNKVESSVYKSAWWSQNVRVRRSLLLLGGQLRKPIKFTAGPFSDLNIASFLAILRGSYSFYTLLSKKED